MFKLFMLGVLFVLVFAVILVYLLLVFVLRDYNSWIFEFLAGKFLPLVSLLILLVSVFCYMIPPVSAGFFDSLGFGSSCSSSPDADPEAPPRLEASQNASQEASQETAQDEGSQDITQETAQDEGSQDVSQETAQYEGSQDITQQASQDSTQEDQQAVLADLLNRIFYEVRTIRSLLNAQAAETDFIGTVEASEEVSDASELETGDSSGADRNISFFSVPPDSSGSGSDSDSSSSSSAEADSSAGAEDVPAEVTLLTIHTDIWLLLFTLWGFAGLFFAFKVGGVLLGRL